MKKALKDLEESFQPYAMLWEQWSKYKFSGLTEEDLYIIQVHSNNNFLFIEHDVIMFYNRPEKIFQLVQKLKNEYQEFQEWVIKKFCITILSNAAQHGYHSFLEKPIMLLNISTELKHCLSSFGFVRVSELLDTLSYEDFKEPRTFNNMVSFLSINYNADKLFLTEA